VRRHHDGDTDATMILKRSGAAPGKAKGDALTHYTARVRRRRRASACRIILDALRNRRASASKAKLPDLAQLAGYIHFPAKSGMAGSGIVGSGFAAGDGGRYWRYVFLALRKTTP